MWTIQILYSAPDPNTGEPVHEGWNDWSGRDAYVTLERAMEVLLRQLERPFLKSYYSWRLFNYKEQTEIPADIFQK